MCGRSSSSVATSCYEQLELDYAARGAEDLDLDAVVAARLERIARAEDSAIFHGFPAGGHHRYHRRQPSYAYRGEERR